MRNLPFKILALALLLMSPDISLCKTLGVSVARGGQTATYELLKDILTEVDPDLKVSKFHLYDAKELEELRPGDTLLINIYNPFEGLYPMLQALRAKGVRVLIDVEITGPQHFPVLEYPVFKNYLRKFEMVTSSKVVADAIKEKWPNSKVILAPHLETLYFRNPPQAVEQFLTNAAQMPQAKRVLLIHEYPDWGTDFVFDYFANLDRASQPAIQTILALHPHTPDHLVAMFRSRFGGRSDVQIVWSTRGFKTNDFFPVVDGVVSHSSTLLDVARRSRLRTYDAKMGQDFRGLPKFLDSLDPEGRPARQDKLRRQADQTITAWTKLIYYSQGHELCREIFASK